MSGAAPLALGLRRRARQLRRRVTGNAGAYVLMYHRIADPAADPWGLAVTPARFAEQLDALARHAHPMGLEALARAREAGTLPPNAVAVTFDDGYRDNLRAARPILARRGVPATVFLATAYAGRGRAYWWEEVQRLVLGPHPLPSELALAAGAGAPFRRALPPETAAPRSPDADRAWRAFQAAPDGRQALFLDLWEWCAALGHEARADAVAALAAAVGLPAEPPPDDDARAMDAAEVRALVDGGLVAVGAHTVTHPMLPALPIDRQRAEVEGSRDDVAALVGRPPATFSYPHGRWDAATARLVRAAGFAAIGTSGGGEDPYDCRPRRGEARHLPRVPVHDWDGDELLRRMRHGFEG